VALPSSEVTTNCRILWPIAPPEIPNLAATHPLQFGVTVIIPVALQFLVTKVVTKRQHYYPAIATEIALMVHPCACDGGTISLRPEDVLARQADLRRLVPERLANPRTQLPVRLVHA